MYSNEIICNILNYIDDNINSKITIEDLTKKFYFNRYYIMKLFKKEIGITIIEYINKLRIYNSISYIKNNNETLIKTAIKNGFYSLEYFSELFSSTIGINPTSFKKFLNYNLKKDEETLNKIRDNLINLHSLINFVNTYKTNLKPKHPPIKKLSIFN